MTSKVLFFYLCSKAITRCTWVSLRVLVIGIVSVSALRQPSKVSSDVDLSDVSSSTTPSKRFKLINKQQKTDKKSYDQKFRNEWLNDPRLSCIRESKNPLKCWCSACNVSLHSGKSELLKHTQTMKHKKNIEKGRTNLNIDNMLKSNENERKVVLVHKKNVSEAEIKLSCFYAEHNIAFQTIEHMVPLLKEIAPDSKIIKDIQLGRTKCTSIVKNVIGKKETEDLVAFLRQQNFCILVDESTDISTKKLLAVLVKFWGTDTGSIKTNLLELITLDGKDCTAQNLFKEFEACLVKFNIPLKNVIGMACDNASVMLGHNNSFKTRLEQATDLLIVIPCICHSAALVASKACRSLPRTPEEFLSSVSTYFSQSSKRVATLIEFQDFFQVQANKILRLSGTRWLRMHQCVSRILDNWQPLTEYFTLAVFEYKTIQAEFILEQLKQSMY